MQQNPYSWSPTPQQPQPSKGWWGRNWKWFLPTGCLGLLLLIVAFVAAIVFFVFSTIKSSDVYRNAVEQARANPSVVQEMGEPIEEGWYVTGSVKNDFASLEIPISGPKRSGTIYAVALRDAGEWQYTRLEVKIEGIDGRVQILNPLLPPALRGLESEVEEDAPTPPPVGSASPASNSNAGRMVSGGVLNGKAISMPQPPYPAIAKAARASGTVTVQVVVDETGRVTEARPVGGHPLLQQAAAQAARQARFSPTLLSGKPVKVSGVLTYNFVLE
ncbi:MAG TPA: cytochrome c oxidase assembly factor Coa1 family protein [Pyrinomonadaceae bacterium]|nr:cytochrome c oxidase assembly factor Coa1 family protein [Pyrinomonadaceae bacterium]